MENFLLGTKGRELAVLNDADQVDGDERARTMCDYDRDTASVSHPVDRLSQSRIAFGVEIGVWLIEDNQEGVVVKSACERDALTLPGRKCGAVWTERSLVAIRHSHDHLVDTGCSGCG